MKLNGLEKYFKTDKNGEIVDLFQTNVGGVTPLMYVFIYNKSANLNLNHEQLDYLIKNSDLNQVNEYNSDASMCAFMNNKIQELNLSTKQLDYLIKNSNLKNMNKYGFNSFSFALYHNKKQELNLTKKQWKYLIDNSDCSLIQDKEQLLELKKIQSELLNDEIFNKIDMKEDINKKNKI